MKNVLLSADVDLFVFSVPDVVADNLKYYCFKFIEWLHSSEGKRYRSEKYNDETICCLPHDFIDYLNTYKFPHEQSSFVENLGKINSVKNLPEHYRKYKKFNF